MTNPQLEKELMETADTEAGIEASIQACSWQLHRSNLTTTVDYTIPSGTATHIAIAAAAWSEAAAIAKRCGLRWAGVWSDHIPPRMTIMVLLAGKDGHLLLSTTVPDSKPELPSQAEIYPNANRSERHVHDMFGITFSAHPDPRPWTRHQAWGADVYPLRRDFPVTGFPVHDTPADNTYPFIKMEGEDIYEVPVGPVHAGIIEPGHFRFHTIGEDMLRLEERLGYVHKGIEKVAQGRDIPGLIRLAARVSGDSSIAHSWAACQAVEHALDIKVPPRALALRAILAERERIANHCGDIGAVCNDVGFSFAMVQFSALREQVQRLNMELFGHRLLMDCLQAGGVLCDLDAAGVSAILAELRMLRSEVAELMPMILEYPSLQDRLRTTGILTHATAVCLGTLGYVARASNIDYDLRRDAPYPPYASLEVRVPVYTESDVAKRTRVRGDEVLVSTQLIEELLHTLPDGPIDTTITLNGHDAAGIGLIEGWRGETLAYVRLDATGMVERYFPRDPSWFNWQALEETIHGNIIPDFPVCNKSVNGSYAGHDL